MSNNDYEKEKERAYKKVRKAAENGEITHAEANSLIKTAKKAESSLLFKKMHKMIKEQLGHKGGTRRKTRSKRTRRSKTRR